MIFANSKNGWNDFKVIVLAISSITVVCCLANFYLAQSSARESFFLKGNTLVDFTKNSSTNYLLTYDLYALEDLVNFAQQDPQVAFAAFYNEKGELLTKNSRLKIESSKDLLFEREMLTAGNRKLGKILVGYRVEAYNAQVYRAVFSTLITVLITMSVLAFVIIRVFVRREQLIFSQQETLSRTSKYAAMGEMAGGVAHEVNNPLAIIKTVSEQLQELVLEEPFDRDLASNLLKRIQTTAERIAKIVNGLRAVSREGTKDPFFELDLKSVLEANVALCKERFYHHGVELILDPIPQGILVKGRETQLSQVLLNLMNNSFDAIAKSQKPWVRISVAAKQDMVELMITDSGKGLSDEVRRKLFQPFFTTKEIGKGTGLGLSISQGIIKEHGGELRLDSKCVNTRFIISLPAVAQAEKKAKAA